MIDWGRVGELRDEIGNEDFADVVNLFLEEVGETLDTLNSNPAELGARLHFLRGSAWNLGFRAFGDLCHQGEQLCAAGQPQRVDIAALRRCYSESCDVFLAGA
ncbi:Hpt domain-containing protein [Paenirhodobacter sp.]|uniref:Hpt domain-containing protein n=1 Tax=Paenirhodobacter sp. TaxID=1965326 RepID=UPI003B3DFF4E